MKLKRLFGVMLVLMIFFFNSASTEKIPYPKNLDTTTEGASAAPPEINHKNSIYFTENDFYNMSSTADRIILKNYRTYQQTTEYTCGPAAALTVLYYFGEKNFDEMTLAKEMKTKPFKGTTTKNMANFFEKIGWEVESSLHHKKIETYDDFKNFIMKNLYAGTPIIVENVEWGGHWRVIIGYDTLGTEDNLDDVLIMAEPYDTSDHNQDGYAINNGWRFFSMWFDHSLFPKTQKNQPFIITHPKK